MNIKSAKFIKGILENDDVLEDGKPQIAFIGRSNVGKSCTINSLTKQSNLARTSSFPGRTREINVFLINNAFYLLDLPGYGFVKSSQSARERLQKLIDWYLIDSHYEQKAVVIIVDAEVGIMRNDLEMISRLEEKGKNIIIIANKIDKIKKSEYVRKLQKIQEKVGNHKAIPFSAKKKIGIDLLCREIFG
jgi:GTP-binding protein